MVEVKVYSDIANEKDGVFLSMFGLEDAVFSADMVKKIFENNQSENDFRFNFHCDGGSVFEGLAIYDIMRTSGKNIHCHIDGGCHSMAVCLLLAAPIENRTANQNCRALIHRVRGGVYESANADEIRQYAEEMEREENAILDIYVERTGTDREVLKNLMHEEKTLTSQQLKEHGFISQIKTYNTNFKTSQKMNKIKQILNAAGNALAKLENLLNEGDLKNFDHTDADGNVLFSTEADDDTLEIGMPASPDGRFELPNGVVVIITNGVITEFISAPEEINEEIENLNNRIVELENALRECQTVITDLRNQVSSTYTAAQRNSRVSSKGNQNNVVKTKDENKDTVNENRKNWKGKK